MTPFRAFVEKWRSCQLCELCRTRSNIVLCRGQVPAEIVFVGEGPGSTEDVLGLPFVGPAGKLLDQIIVAACLGDRRYALTNLVACLPIDDGGGKGEPAVESIRACQPRLREFIELCLPRLIVCVGSMARDWLDPTLRGGLKLAAPVRMIDILHPAAILRKPTAARGLEVQRCVVQIANAVEELEVTK